jgi:hypothetical protein
MPRGLSSSYWTDIMALTTNGFTSYSSKGNREDLEDTIYDISPMDTPYISMIGRGKATAVYHEWQNDALAAAVTTNNQLEGDDVTPAATTATTRTGTFCQISRKSLALTGTQMAIKKAGRKSERAYQMARRGKEIKRDMESSATQNQPEVAGGATTARRTRGFETYILTNDSRGGGSGAQATVPTASPTDGTQRTLTETIFKDAIQTCWDTGADIGTAITGPYAKRLISGFSGRSNAVSDVTSERTIMASASMYASDFGDIKIVPNRFSRARSILLINQDPKEYAEISFLRPFQTEDLAKIGDSERAFMLAEWAHCVKNEKAMGIIADLHTAAT